MGGISKMKKSLSLLLATLMIVSLAGCNRKKDDTPAAGTVAESSGVVNEYGWEVPKETITISFYAGYGDQAEDDKLTVEMAKFYKEKFNVQFKKTLYSIDMVEKLNLMLASNDYPEVITWMPDDMAEKFIMQGKAQELTPLIDKYGSNIKRRLGDYLNLLKTDDGKIYKLPIGWGENQNVAGYDFAMRYDMWKTSGLPLHTSLEEYYQNLKKLVELNPKNANGEKVYALSDNSQGAGLYGAMLAAYGFKNGFKVNESTGEFTHWMNTDEGLQIAKYINRFVREGLMDPDFLTNKLEDWQTKVTNGRVLGNIGTWWHTWVAGHEAWAQQEGDAYTIEKRFMNTTIKAPGVEEQTSLSSNFLGASRVIITDKCKQPENIMKWWNWETSELGTMITSFGPPSDDNVWNIKDGKWIFKEDTFDNATKNEKFHKVLEKWGAKAFWMTTSAGWLKDDHLDTRVTRVNAYDYWPINEKGEFLDEGVRICWQNSEGKSWDSTLFQVTYPADNPITITNQTIKDTLLSEWAKIITSKSEEEVIQKFTESRDKLNNIGLKDLEKYNAESYKRNKEKLGK